MKLSALRALDPKGNPKGALFLWPPFCPAHHPLLLHRLGTGCLDTFTFTIIEVMYYSSRIFQIPRLFVLIVAVLVKLVLCS